MYLNVYYSKTTQYEQFKFVWQNCYQGFRLILQNIFMTVSFYIQGLCFALSQAVTAVFIHLILMTKDIYEEKRSL